MKFSSRGKGNRDGKNRVGEKKERCLVDLEMKCNIAMSLALNFTAREMIFLLVNQSVLTRACEKRKKKRETWNVEKITSLLSGKAKLFLEPWGNFFRRLFSKLHFDFLASSIARLCNDFNIFRIILYCRRFETAVS